MPVRAIASPIAARRVTLADGKVLEADHVILTAPPSTWNRIAFDPLLPATLAPQMATNVKCLIALKGRFWRTAELGPELLSDGPVSLTWDGTDGQPGGAAAMVAFSGGNAPISAASGGRRRGRRTTWRRSRRSIAASGRIS